MISQRQQIWYGLDLEFLQHLHAKGLVDIALGKWLAHESLNISNGSIHWWDIWWTIERWWMLRKWDLVDLRVWLWGWQHALSLPVIQASGDHEMSIAVPPWPGVVLYHGPDTTEPVDNGLKSLKLNAQRNVPLCLGYFVKEIEGWITHDALAK